MKKLLLVSLCFLSLFVTQVYAQNRTITGTVTSKDDGLPLPGVSVTVTGTTVGTQTGASGRFTLNVPASAKTLSFSFIGYTAQRVAIAGSTVNAVLASSASQLNEVVVTGVGVATQKRQVAIDVASVSPKNFAATANVSAAQALIGQVAGAQIQQTSGTPGAGTQIILRGYTNLGSSNPLILVDGVQVDSDVLDIMDPNTVDHIEVVKGSAGGMLYGSRGGNGVIQIFTKKGAKNGKLAIDFSSKFSRDKVLAKNELVADKHHFVTDASNNILDANGDPIARDEHGIWTSPAEEAYASDPKNVKNDKTYSLPVFNHIDQGYRVANTYNNSLNIRGGSEKTDYAFGVSNLSQQDVFSNNYNRTNLSMNLGFNPVKGLTFRNHTQFIYTYENLIGGSRFNLVNSYPFIDFNYIDPTTGLRTVKPSEDIDGNNSLTERDYHTHSSKTPRLLENFNVNYKFPKFVELDYKYSLDYRTTDTYDYYKNQLNTYQDVSWGPKNGQITDQYGNSKIEYNIASLFFRTDFKNDFHSSLPIKTTTQVSYDANKRNYRYFYSQGTGLTPYPPVNINGSATKTAGDGSDASNLMYGVLVNQTIDFGNLFGVSGGFRSDYSSVFGNQGKPFTFPRGTAYFNPSELFKNHDLVYNWKVRAAYGKAGVQPGDYDRQLILDVSNLGPSGTNLSNQTTARNPFLNVQVTSETEIGTDVTFTPGKGNWFSNITFSGSYWTRSSDDIIQNAKVAPSSGFLSTLNNLISLKSHGIDLTLDANAFKSEDFGWDVGLRFAKARTEVTKLSNSLPVFAGAFILKQGEQLGALYGQTPLHSVDQLKPDGTRYIPQASVGDYVMVDGNVVNKNTYSPVITASNDQSNMGNTNPDFTASMFNRFRYKKLSFAFQFDWSHGNKMYNLTRQWLYRDRLSKDFDRSVTIDGNTGAFVNYYAGYYNTLNPVSWFVEDASFIRLRDISLGYDLTSLINPQRTWIKTVNVSVAARNLLTFTKYKGLDPEATSAVDSQGTGLSNIGSYRGIDYYSSPNLKTFQFALNVGF